MERRTDAAVNGHLVTPGDAPLPATTRGLMVGAPGDVAVTFSGTAEEPGNSVLLPALQPGVLYPVQVERVHAAGTTAGGIVALW